MSAFIGTDLARPEGRDKVTGRAVYVADLRGPGAWPAWIGGAVRSDVACGRVAALERDPAFDWSRVVVVGPADVPGRNRVAMIADDQPILAGPAGERVRHVGEPLLLVAAPDRATLAAALAAVTVHIEPEPACFDMEAAPDVLHALAIDKGDVERALDAAPLVVEHTWRTDTQEQMYIEPQGMLAWPADERFATTVRGSLQCPFYVQRALAQALGVSPERARVVQTATGGGFGGKEDYPSVLACHAALLARAAGRPVAMIHDRHTDLAVTPKRHPSRVRHRTGVDRDGNLLAMDVDVLLDGGAYTTLSPVVLSRACIHAAGAYRCANVRIRGRAVATNNVPYGAFRGFGAPQVCFAVERQMDRVAAKLGMHPAELRRRNVLRVGDTTATSQVLRSSVGSAEVFARAMERTGFERHDWRGAKRASSRKRLGVGMSLFFHGAGFTGSGEERLKGAVAVELRPDGGALVRTAATEFGQGTHAMLRAIAAEALGLAPERVALAEADTARVPDSGPTVASRTCMVVGACVERACRELAARVQGVEGASFAEKAARFVAAGGDAVARAAYASPPDLEWDEERYRGDAYPAYGWACDVAEVAVDLDTFEVEVTRFASAVDVGRALQPGLVEGQIEGGSLQAIGFAHLEVVRTAGGRVLSDRMATSIIPGTLDTPPFEIDLIEIPFEHGPFGAKGVGELPMDGGAPAVASAIEDALGVVVDRLPATPERLMDLWLAAHPGEAAEGPR
jgi:CO/xanthine dehydrogenase Mo-binding subunit